MKHSLHSNRMYLLVWIDRQTTISMVVSIQQIVGLEKFDDGGIDLSDTELLYSIQDDLDSILDLKEDEVIWFQLDRNNDAEVGLLKRLR